IFTAPRETILEHDHAGHHVGALNLRDVEALDAQRRLIHAERLGDLFERLAARRQIGRALELVLSETLGGVALDGLHERALVAALRHADAHAAPPMLREPLG